MIVEVAVSGKKVMAKAHIQLNFQNRTWSVRQDYGWRVTGLASQGLLRRYRSDLVLEDPKSSIYENYITLINSPSSESDSARRSGRGLIEEPDNSRLIKAEIRWHQQVEVTAIRKKILSVIRNKAGFAFSPKYKFDFPNPPPSEEMKAATRKLGYKTGKGDPTNCGEFPAWILRHLGSNIPKDVTAEKKTQWGPVGGLRPTIAWHVVGQMVESRRRLSSGTIWIPYSSNGARPKPGDFYILSESPGRRSFQHVGVIVNSLGSSWTTADCGQGTGFSGCYQQRKWDKAAGTLTLTSSDPKLRQPDLGTLYLMGWVDVDALLPA